MVLNWPVTDDHGSMMTDALPCAGSLCNHSTVRWCFVYIAEFYHCFTLSSFVLRMRCV